MAINTHPNYRGTPWKPSAAQTRVLDRFRVAGGVRQLPASPEHWSRADRLAMQALVRRGAVQILTGPTENHYLLTYGGQRLLKNPNAYWWR